MRLLDDLIRELLGLVEVRGDGADLVDRELVREVANRLLLLRERELEGHDALRAAAGHELGRALADDDVAMLVDRLDLQLPLRDLVGGEGDRVTRFDHTRETN